MNKKLAPNTNLLHYKIISAIGKGGMGEVFLAQDTKLDRKVALKILPPEFAEDRDRMSRFVREAKSASALNHPNIITIYEIGESGGTHFIATEFIDGKTLSEYVKANPLNYKSALEIAVQVAAALDEAHLARIVHRDIKPDNVMVRSNGLVKILDFGIAKLSESRGAKGNSGAGEADETAIQQPSTSPGMIIGTANYMSAEQAKGEPVDARSDIFSFGVVLYEMVSGHLPFEGKTPMEIIGAIIHKEPKPLDKTDVPPEIERIIGKTLRKDRSERYQTIKDVLIDLKDVKRELEFQDKLEKTVPPNKQEPQTRMLKATTYDAEQQTATNDNLNDSITIKKSNVSKALIGVFAILLISVIGFGYWFYSASASKQIESIAVMPFVNESKNEDVEYLSDGMTETLISSLSQLPNLNVKGRSSVFRYKGKDLDTKTLGKELGVQAVLYGRVIQRGDQLTLSLELLDAVTENVIWSGKYDRKQADVVSLQSEIARDVSNKLKTKLSGADVAKVEKRYTPNPEAYRLYLRGRFYWNKRTGPDLKKSIEYFDQAIALDPGYALAYSGLAAVYQVLPGYASDPPPQVTYPKARVAAQKALEIDPNMAEPNATLAVVLHEYDWKHAEAEKEFKRAIEIDPNYASAHQWYGSFLADMGRFDDGAEELKRALELDPFSPIINANLGYPYRAAHRYDDALAQYKKTLEIAPNFEVAQFHLSRTYFAAGMYEQAIELNRQAGLSQGDPAEKVETEAAGARDAYRRGGERGFWQFILEREQKAAREMNRDVDPYSLARLQLGAGSKDQALDSLEKAVAAGKGQFEIMRLKAEPMWDPLRTEPRFKDLLRKIGLPE